MKKLFTSFFLLFIGLAVFAQTPTTFNYQAVLRDASGGILTNQKVEIGIAILQSSATGNEVFSETHSVTTNNFGLVNLQIGSVNTTGMQNIDWSTGPYFIQISVDGVIMGTSQLLSVPYALHAKVAEMVIGGIIETDPVYSGSEAANITATDISNLSNLSGTNTGDQDLSALASKIALGDSTAQVRSEIPDVSEFLTPETDPLFSNWDRSTGISITESQISDLDHFRGDDISGNETAFDSWDKDASDDFDGHYSSLSGAPKNVSAFINDAAYITSADDADNDPTNELQVLSISNDTIYLSNGGKVKLPDETDPVFSSWDKSTGISITESQISDLQTYLTTEVDGSATNELQALSISNDTIYLSDGGKVKLPAETDPAYTSSQAFKITADDITNLGNLSGTNTGDQDISTLASKTALGDSTVQVRSEIPDVSGFLTSYTETDPAYTSSQAFKITADDITNLGNLSGTNTGDQDISTLASKNALGDSTAQVRSEIPDVSGFLTSYTETDPTYTSSEAANITATDITHLGNLSGINTGDQDLNTLATKNALGDSTAQVRSEIPDVSGFISAEEDPIYAADSSFLKSGVTAWDTSVAKTITAVDTANWNNKVDTLIAGTGITISGDTIKAIGSNSSTTYSVGDFAQGGIVFWVDETGQHGLVCAKEDQSTGVRWYAGTTGNTQAKGDGPYAGEANTSIIIAAQVAIGDDGETYGARICNELQITEGGKTYGDWYLPSKGELNLMFVNKAIINATAIASGGSGLDSRGYWSSTEDFSKFAWSQSFSHGNQNDEDKFVIHYVRAIRAF